jgi:hypothetical protein
MRPTRTTILMTTLLLGLVTGAIQAQSPRRAERVTRIQRAHSGPIAEVQGPEYPPLEAPTPRPVPRPAPTRRPPLQRRVTTSGPRIHPRPQAIAVTTLEVSSSAAVLGRWAKATSLQHPRALRCRWRCLAATHDSGRWQLSSAGQVLATGWAGAPVRGAPGAWTHFQLDLATALPRSSSGVAQYTLTVTPLAGRRPAAATSAPVRISISQAQAQPAVDLEIGRVQPVVERQLSTRLQVRQLGGDFTTWGNSLSMTTPHTTTFRFSTDHADATSGFWQLSEEPFGPEPAEDTATGFLGVAAAPPGQVAQFTINLQSYLPDEPVQSPRTYYVRIYLVLPGWELANPPSNTVQITITPPGPDTQFDF